MAIMRLDKFLSNHNFGSRKDVGKLIKSGDVLVNGSSKIKSDMKVDPDIDVIEVFGEKVNYSEHVYIMMNKPEGVLSTTEDKKQLTVIDLVPMEWSQTDLFPAGRLDKNTTGLLIITNDGDLAHRMLSPKKHVWKIYEAKLDKPAEKADIEAFSKGIVSGDIEFLPAELWIPDEADPYTVRVKIREGKFHQVKKMIAECGKEVIKLKRLQIGELKLDENLLEGECRLMTDKELKEIFVQN